MIKTHFGTAIRGKQIAHAEAKPLGRVNEDSTKREQSSARKMPLETTMEFPVGRSRAIVKPGSE